MAENKAPDGCTVGELVALLLKCPQTAPIYLPVYSGQDMQPLRTGLTRVEDETDPEGGAVVGRYLVLCGDEEGYGADPEELARDITKAFHKPLTAPAVPAEAPTPSSAK